MVADQINKWSHDLQHTIRCIIIIDPNGIEVYSKQNANLFACLLCTNVAVWPNIAVIIDQPEIPGLATTNPGILDMEIIPRGCQA